MANTDKQTNKLSKNKATSTRDRRLKAKRLEKQKIDIAYLVLDSLKDNDESNRVLDYLQGKDRQKNEKYFKRWKRLEELKKLENSIHITEQLIGIYQWQLDPERIKVINRNIESLEKQGYPHQLEACDKKKLLGLRIKLTKMQEKRDKLQGLLNNGISKKQSWTDKYEKKDRELLKKILAGELSYSDDCVPTEVSNKYLEIIGLNPKDDRSWIIN